MGAEGMEALMDYIKDKGTPIYVTPGSILTFKLNNQHACYFMESGLSVLHCFNNSKPLAIINKSQLLGLNYLVYPHGELKLKIIHSSVIYAVPVTSLLPIINEANLWPNVASYLAQQIYVLVNCRDKKKHTSILIVQTLKMLQAESEEVKLTHTVSHYIREITGLSLSTINRSLEILKQEGSIDVQNGVLLRCDLP